MAGSLSIYWTVSEIEHQSDFTIRRNIKKPILFPRYQGHVGEIETVLAYVGSKEIDPGSTLNIIRKEDSIAANSRSAFAGEIQWQGTGQNIGTKRFLLTDVIGDFVGVAPVPYYWKHVIPSTSASPDSIAILDSELKEVDSESYLAVRTPARDASDLIVDGEYEDCSVFSNYLNSYNQETGEVEAYYVRFEADGVLHYQLMNSVPAFSVASFDDVSSVTGRLKTWRKVYTVSPTLDGYLVQTPRTDVDYFLKPLDRGRIYMMDPPDASDQSPWFPRVSDGSFSNLVDEDFYYYSVPEYSNQVFSPLEPYKAAVEEEAEMLDGDLLTVTNTPLNVDYTSLYNMDVIIRDINGNTVYALTTQTSLDGEAYYEGDERVYREVESEGAWVTWDADGILGWDVESGFIHLRRRYPDTYSFYVSYNYEAVGYEYTRLNLNPVFDETYDGEYHVVYVVPTGGNNANVSTQVSSVHYIKVNRSGQVQATSQDSTSGNFDLNDYIQVDGEYFHYSHECNTTAAANHLASGTSLVVNLDSTMLLSSGDVDLPERGVLLVGAGIGETLTGSANPAFAVGYSSWTATSSTVTFTLSGTLDYGFSSGEPVRLFSFRDLFSTDGDNKMQWLVLAEVHTGTTSRPEHLSIIDLRKQGGVLKEDYYKLATKIDPRAVWARPTNLQTIGQPIPGNSAVVFKIPFTLLEDYGGTFQPSEIEEIVARRHLATGMVPIIIYHGAIPEITDLSSTMTTVTVTWHLEGEGYSYNVYYSTLSNGPWTLANSSLIAEGAYGNTFTITGLTPGLIYYIVVTSVDSDSIESPRSIPWKIKTRTS